MQNAEGFKIAVSGFRDTIFKMKHFLNKIHISVIFNKEKRIIVSRIRRPGNLSFDATVSPLKIFDGLVLKLK